MRLALLGYHHETNTFATGQTEYAHFERGGILRGAEVVRQHAGATSTVAGFLEAGRLTGEEVVPLLYFITPPSGLITRDAYQRITAELLEALEAQGPWDGVLLALHGAAVAVGYPDADGHVAARVRALVGPGVPIGLALDLHANVSAQLVEAATVTIFYRTNPHLDARERARECGELVVRTVRGEIRPVQALETPPLVVNILKQFTGAEPLRSLMNDVEALLERPGMLSASVGLGYPYADVPQMGMSFLTVHDGDSRAAREAARWLARRAWFQRADYVGEAPGPDEAVRAALAAPRSPVVLMDVGDNIGGGSPGDSTVLLEAARRQGARGYLQTLCDPAAVAACAGAGVGATVALSVGARIDDRHGRPMAVTGRVRLLSDGQFEDPRPTHGGWRYFDAGTTAVLETDDGYTLVLTTERLGNTSIEQMYSLGIRPEGYRIVVAKGVISPRPAYEPIAAQMILVNTPGVTSADLSTFHYEWRRRPLYPFEPETAYEPISREE
jgi:microcystin degradation protein MlrC